MFFVCNALELSEKAVDTFFKMVTGNQSLTDFSQITKMSAGVLQYLGSFLPHRSL